MTQSLTVSHLFGEICWLLTQSKLHKQLPIFTLESLVMPALLHEQLYIFRDGDKPVGLALWAYCDEAAEKKLETGLLGGKNPFSERDWKSGDRLWLVDLVAPFATDENRQRELMLADLVSGPLKGKAFKFHKTEFGTGRRSAVEVPANAGERLAEQLGPKGKPN